MDEARPRGVPWGQLFTLALLALVVAAARRGAPGDVTLAAVTASAAAFFILHRLQNYFWGLSAAALLTLHPLYLSSPAVDALRAEAAELAVLAAVAAGCSLAALPAFTPWAWSLTSLALVLGGALAWPAVPQAGLVTAAITAIGLLGGAALAAARRGVRPAWGNVAAAALLGLGAPAAALLLAPAGVWLLGVGHDAPPLDLLDAALHGGAGAVAIRGFAAEELPRWAWPAVGVVMPLAAWGLWRTLVRGRRERAAGRPPLPWLLTLYAAADVTSVALRPAGPPESVLLPLASLAVLLSVFGVAEIFRWLTRPLLLPPPEERLREEIEGG